MTQTYGPFGSGSGANLPESWWIQNMGPLLQAEGVLGAYGSTQAQPYADSSGMKVFVRAGKAYARGVAWVSDAVVQLTVGANATGQNRIDRIVLRMDPAADTFLAFLIPGTPGAGAPDPTRSPTGTWDVNLGTVLVSPGASTIAPGNVTDSRDYLPLPLREVNSAFGLPLADGSAGTMVLYDSNPSVQNVLVSNGSTWRGVAYPPADGGWLSVGPVGNWLGQVQYRIIANRITWRLIAVHSVSHNTNPDLCVASWSLRPPVTGGAVTFQVSARNSVDYSLVGASNGSKLTDWVLTILLEGPTDIRLRVEGGVYDVFYGTDNIMFEGQFSYLLD